MVDWARYLIPTLRRAARAVNALVPGPARAHARRSHSRPREECPLAIEGHPYYLAGLTIGSPVADFGSHAGVKAATGRGLLEIAHYAGFGAIASRIDSSALALEGLPLARTELVFRPWGWIERAQGPGARAEARVATVAEDAFLFSARVRNVGETPFRFRPRLEILEETDPVHEGEQPFHLSRRGRWSAAADEAGLAHVRYRRRLGPGFLAFDDTRFSRAFRFLGGPLVRAPRGPALASFVAGEHALAPGASCELAFLMGAGETPDEAWRALARGEEKLARGPEHALEEVEADWQTFLASLPLPADPTPDVRRVVDLAATSLRMNLFAPRGALAGRIVAAAKIHFNGFWAWDTPLCALAIREWDPPLAKEVISTHLALAQRKSGIIVYAVGARGEALRPEIERVSQPPVVFLAAEAVFRKDGARDLAWLGAVYDRLARNAAWWDAARRDRETGLYCYANALESGWDDTPRIPNRRVPPMPALGLDLGNLSGLEPVDRLASVDLNAWLFMAFEAMERLAARLGRERERARWAARAAELGGAVERLLWDEEKGAYFDRDLARGRPVRVLTPAIAWPLMAGITRDAARARRVIEGHLLDPQKFMPEPENGFPVPSVAFSDPAYSREEDGYYWRGQIWLVPCFAVASALFRYGYEKEAAALRVRVLALLAGACEGGLFETYDARTGEIGFGSGSITGAGEPAAFQIGITTAPALELALGRHERRREILPGEAGFCGLVEEARTLADGAPFYRIVSPEDEVPRACVRLEGGAVEVTLDDPARTFGRDEAVIEVLGERRVVKLGERSVFLPPRAAVLAPERG